MQKIEKKSVNAFKSDSHTIETFIKSREKGNIFNSSASSKVIHPFNNSTTHQKKAYRVCMCTKPAAPCFAHRVEVLSFKQTELWGLTQQLFSPLSSKQTQHTHMQTLKLNIQRCQNKSGAVILEASFLFYLLRNWRIVSNCASISSTLLLWCTKSKARRHSHTDKTLLLVFSLSISASSLAMMLSHI